MSRRGGTAGEPASKSALVDSAMDRFPVGFSIYDTEHRLIRWNRAFLEIQGLDGSKLFEGIPLRETIVLSYQAGNFPGRELAEVLETQSAKVMSTKADRQEETETRGRTIRRTRKKLDGLGWFVTYVDVTGDLARIENLKRREEDLQLQHSRLEAAVRNVPAGMCMYDRDNHLVVWNEQFCSIFGVPHEHVTRGMHLREFLELRVKYGPPIDEPHEVYIERRLKAALKSKSESYEVKLPDGRIILIARNPTPEGGWVSTHQDITEQRRNQERVEHLAHHDSLTDLPNRRVLENSVAAAKPHLQRGAHMAMLCIDLDHFKPVNDTHGHGVGDEVLKAVADRMRQNARETDVIARLGGDEFAFFVGPLAKPQEVSRIADRLIRSLSQPIAHDGHDISIGASIGIAIAPEDGIDFDTLMKNGDLALYRAKHDGRGSFRFFEQEMDAAQQERRAIKSGLRKAIENGELSVSYQPFVNLESQRISGFEALLRWNRPNAEPIGPQTFIPVAEETGLIVPIGEWVLREACLAAAQWPDDISIAVNLSPAQFKGGLLVRQITEAIENAGLRPERLELEITESLLLADVEATLKILHQLRSIGIRISMDDFGTGYSSLSYLRSFPFDKIKIDRSFVENLKDSGSSHAIVKAVVGLGQSLGMATTAEGVETEGQLKIVREEGYTDVQGFLFSLPLPLTAANELLRTLGYGPTKMPSGKSSKRRSA